MAKTSPTDGDLQPGQARAMRLRAYPSRGQSSRAGHWLWVAQKFRNEAVAFIADRRRQRAAWLRQHPALARDGIDPALAGSDAAACSRWLTSRLDLARHDRDRAPTRRPVVRPPAVQRPIVQHPPVQRPIVERPSVQPPTVDRPMIRRPRVTERPIQRPAPDRSVGGSSAPARRILPAKRIRADQALPTTK